MFIKYDYSFQFDHKQKEKVKKGRESANTVAAVDAQTNQYPIRERETAAGLFNKAKLNMQSRAGKAWEMASSKLLEK